MIWEAALAAAGTDARLVHRPGRRTTHLYTGPLTRSGRYVPRARRALCAVHTRQLQVVDRPVSSLDPDCPWRMCRRCVRALGTPASRVPASRAELVAAHGSTTRDDVAFALEVAETETEVDAAALLEVTLFGIQHPARPWRNRHGQSCIPTHRLVCRARTRVGGYDDTLIARTRAALVEDAAELRAREKAERTADFLERQELISRIGIAFVKPDPPARHRPAREQR